MKFLATAFLCLAVSLTGAKSSRAQANNWLGTTNANWFNGNNWDQVHVPLGTENVFIDTNSPNLTNVGSAGAQARSLSIGTNAIDIGQLRVQNSGTLSILTTAFIVGNAGTGHVVLRDMSSTTPQQNMIIGAQTGSHGDVTVRDSAVLDVAGQLRVGDTGTGSLTSLGSGLGGFIRATHMDIGTFNGGVGTVELSNAGSFSNLDIEGVTSVGTSGTGQLTLHDGGTMYTSGLSIGTNSDGNGTVIVRGEIAAGTFVSNIIVQNGNNLDVGQGGTGDLELRNGGAVKAENIHVGRDADSVGTLLVRGLSPVTSTASLLTANNDLSVGGTQSGPGGQGILTIEKNGAVKVANNMWVWGGGTGTGGTLEVDTTYTLTVGSTLTFDGGRLHFLEDGTDFTNNVLFNNSQDPSGMIADVDNGNTGTLSGILIGDGALTKVSQGELDVNNNSNAYAGGTFLKKGSLFADANSALGTGTLTISDATTFGSHVDGTNLANSISVKGDFFVTPATTGGRSLFLNGDVDLNGAVRTITNTVDFGLTALSGVIKNGGVTLSSTMPFGIFEYDGAAANTYTGLTTVNDMAAVALNKAVTNGAIAGDLLINPGGVVFLLQAEQIADDSVVTDNSSGKAIPGFTLQGYNEKIGALFGDASGRVGLNNNSATTGGTLSVGAGDFAGVISDAGAGGQLIKYGPGTLILSGDNTYVGETTVNGGVLQVDGSIASANTLVNGAGTLAGIGTIGGDVVNQGTVSPGDSPGTLTITGAYTQNSSGNLVIEIASLATHDLLAVGGAANLDGTLTVAKLANFSVIAGDKIIFLTAAGGVNNKFTTVMSDFGPTGTLIMPEVIYEANDVALLFAQGSFLVGGLTPNQTSVAVNLNNSVGDPRADNLINFLDTEPLANLPHDYDLIAPEELAALYEISFAKAIVQNMNLQHRTDDIRAGSTGFSGSGFSMTTSGSAPLPDPGLTFAYGDGKVVLPVDSKDKNILTPKPENRWGVFVTGSGDFVNVDGNDNAHGYDISTGTVLVGLDYRVCDHFAVGLDGSYSGGRANLVDHGRIDMDGGQAGAYATVYGFKLFGSVIHFDAGVSGGWNDYDTIRTGLQGLPVRGSTNGSEFNAFAAYGGDWHFGRLLIGTWSTLQYTNVNVDGFTETGSLAPLTFPDQNEDSVRGSTGLRLAYDAAFGHVIFRPEMRAAWEHEYGDRAYPIDARFASGAGGIFTVHGPSIGRDSALVDAGFTLLWNERVSTYLFYDGNLGRSHYDNNAVSGGFKVTF